MKYNLFIGRFSPFHDGHKYIMDSFIDNGKPVCVAIRESEEIYPVSLRMAMVKSVYIEQIKQGLVKVISIPDITMVCVGRKVGYGLVEAPEHITLISGTAIREYRIDRGDGSGFFNVPKEVKELIEEWEERSTT